MSVRCRLLSLVLAGYLLAIGATWILLKESSQGYRVHAPEDRFAESRPQEEKFEGYVSSDTCRSCHPGEYHSWHASFHRTMTQVASPSSVLADFDGRNLQFGEYEFRLERRGDEFWTRIRRQSSTGGRDADFVDRKIVMTTGSHHSQVYWLDGHYTAIEERGDRSIWSLPFVYILKDKQWVSRYEAFVEPPDLHKQLPEAPFWNTTCVNCHSTMGSERLLGEFTTAKTRAVEFGISCEACHGPGRAHIAANRDPRHRYSRHRERGLAGPAGPVEGVVDDTIVNPANLDHRRSSQVCGRCHSIIFAARDTTAEALDAHGYPFTPGADLHEKLITAPYEAVKNSPLYEGFTRDEPGYFSNRFWPDGMMRLTGREYHGLMETPCFQRGEMSCLSCHKMHKADEDPRALKEWANDQLAPVGKDNAACLQCHEEFEGGAALASHTHHETGSSGSSCYNCHMPHTSYGLLKAIRSHHISSPNAAVSARTGRPDACNQCHLDKTLKWTAETLARWYQIPVPELDADEREIAASILWAVKGNAAQRALMAWSFGWEEAREISGDDWMPPYLALLMGDTYPAVRYIAARSLDGYPAYTEVSGFPIPQDATSRVFRLWRKLGLFPSAGAGKPLLLGEQGDFDADVLMRLHSEQDRTPIHLQE